MLVPVKLGDVSYDAVLSITEEPSGNLWFVSDNNLVRLFPDGNVQIFGQDFFGRNVPFSEGTPVIKDKVLFLGTADGYVEISLESPTAFVPLLYWRSIQVEDSLFLQTDSVLPVFSGERIKISPVALDYRPGNIRYSYCLDPDAVWRNIEDSGIVELSNLPRGRHILKVRSTDSYGIWVNNDRALIIDVKPFRYWWLWLIGIFFIISVGILLYRRIFTSSGNFFFDVSPSLSDVNSPDGQFLETAKSFVESSIDKPELSVDDFAAYMGMSRTILYNRMKELLDKTPASFTKEMRIKRAVQLLELKSYTVSEIAYMTGFNDAKYFSKVFKRRSVFLRWFMLIGWLRIQKIIISHAFIVCGIHRKYNRRSRKYFFASSE